MKKINYHSVFLMIACLDFRQETSFGSAPVFAEIRQAGI